MMELKGKGTCFQAFNLIDRDRIVRLTFASDNMLVDAVAERGRLVYLVARDRGGSKIFTRETALWFAGMSAGNQLGELKLTELERIRDSMGSKPFLTLEDALRIIKQINFEVAA